MEDKTTKQNKVPERKAAPPRDYRSKRRQDNIEPRLRRLHEEKVRYNDEELIFINEARGNLPRAVYIRMMSLCNEPVIVPEINQGAWVLLATASSALNQVSKKLNFGERVEIEEIREQLSQFRAALLGAEISRGAE